VWVDPHLDTKTQEAFSLFTKKKGCRALGF